MYWKVLPILFNDWWDSLVYEISQPMSTLIWDLLPLGLAFAVFNKKKQIVAIVFGIIYLLNGLYKVFYSNNKFLKYLWYYWKVKWDCRKLYRVGIN